LTLSSTGEMGLLLSAYGLPSMGTVPIILGRFRFFAFFRILQPKIYMGEQLMTTENQTAIAYFAGGCFWGVEHLLRRQVGVISLEVGFMGGTTAKPSYEDVYQELTGHAETVKIVFDPAVISYETLAKYFFEIHDPTQLNRQGPDAGERYRSEIFYISSEQKGIAERLINILKSKGYNVVTLLTPASAFYPAENYHQRYYEKTGKRPYCHIYTPRF